MLGMDGARTEELAKFLTGYVVRLEKEATVKDYRITTLEAQNASLRRDLLRALEALQDLGLPLAVPVLGGDHVR